MPLAKRAFLAYYVEWHMRQALAPILFDDNTPAAADASRVSAIRPAQRSPKAREKAATGLVSSENSSADRRRRGVDTWHVHREPMSVAPLSQPPRAAYGRGASVAGALVPDEPVKKLRPLGNLTVMPLAVGVPSLARYPSTCLAA